MPEKVFNSPKFLSCFFPQFAEDSNKIDERASPINMSAEGNQETVRLPATFGVKFLGKREARGLWGIKYTRKPVDEMVLQAKSLKPDSGREYSRLSTSASWASILYS